MCRQVGGWQDSATGLKIPGPHAVLDPITHAVVELIDFPDPVQIPTHKMSPDLKDPGEFIEVEFFDGDALEIHDGIRLALDTGILEVIDDETVKSEFPNAWAKRRKKWTFEPRAGYRAHEDAEALLDLYKRCKAQRLDETAGTAAP